MLLKDHLFEKLIIMTRSSAVFFPLVYFDFLENLKKSVVSRKQHFLISKLIH